MTEGLITFRVELPEARRRAMGAPKPKARVVLEPDEESLWVAQAVAKKLECDEVARQSPSKEQLMERIEAIEGEIAWQRLLSWLKRRDLTQAEAARRLEREGFSPTSAASAVDRAMALGFINDARYAEAFARAKASAGWGRCKIALELERRGLELDEGQEWVEELLGHDAELERARTALMKKTFSGPRACAKAARFLIGRGYEPSLAWEVARELGVGSAREG